MLLSLFLLSLLPPLSFFSLPSLSSLSLLSLLSFSSLSFFSALHRETCKIQPDDSDYLRKKETQGRKCGTSKKRVRLIQKRSRRNKGYGK
jgi:hypothetical protein